MTDSPSPEAIYAGVHPRILAHLGDGVYELHIRELAVKHALKTGTHRVEDLHRFTTDLANATFQVKFLHALEPHLSEEEQEIVRRGRNVPVSSSRRSNQALYRQSAGFEALIGYLHLTHPARLQEIWQVLAESFPPE